MRRAILGLVLLAGCNLSPYPSVQPNYTGYSFKETYRTPSGVLVDDPNRQLDPDILDRTIANVEACLAQFASAPLTAAERTQYSCSGTPVLSVQAGFMVKVPSDWFVSSCTGSEVFPCDVPDLSCEQKGQTPTSQCPCSCRAMIQDDDKIITAPNLQLFPAQLTQLLTGCEQIWSAGRLVACGNPTLVATNIGADINQMNEAIGGVQ